MTYSGYDEFKLSEKFERERPVIYILFYFEPFGGLR